jgi:hypothetical protein
VIFEAGFSAEFQRISGDGALGGNQKLEKQILLESLG